MSFEDFDEDDDSFDQEYEMLIDDFENNREDRECDVCGTPLGYASDECHNCEVD